MRLAVGIPLLVGSFFVGYFYISSRASSTPDAREFQRTDPPSSRAR